MLCSLLTRLETSQLTCEKQETYPGFWRKPIGRLDSYVKFVTFTKSDLATKRLDRGVCCSSSALDLHRIRNIPGSNLGRDFGYRD